MKYLKIFDQYKKINEGYQVSVVDNMPLSGDKLKSYIIEKYGGDTWSSFTRWADECDSVAKGKNWESWEFSFKNKQIDPNSIGVFFLVNEKGTSQQGKPDHQPRGSFRLDTKEAKIDR